MAVGYIRTNSPVFGPLWFRPRQVAIRVGGQWKPSKEVYIRRNGSWLRWWIYTVNADIVQQKVGGTNVWSDRTFAGTVNSPMSGQYFLTIEVQNPNTGEWTNSNNNWALTTTGGVFRGETTSIANGALNGHTTLGNLPYRVPVTLTERSPFVWSTGGGVGGFPRSQLHLARTFAAPWRVTLQVRVAIDDGINTWYSPVLGSGTATPGITWGNH